MSKYLSVIVAMMIASAAAAQDVIYYEDGTAYTLKEGERIFISKTGKMYKKQSYKNGNVFFTNVTPSDKVDPEESPTDGMEKGSEEWCEAYVPYQIGYTFDDQMYERACNG